MTPKEEPDKNQHNSTMPVPKSNLLSIGGKEDKGSRELQKEHKNFHNLEILSRLVAELIGDTR